MAEKTAKGRLRISDKFSLPLDLVTLTQAILARKRSGKSYTAGVQAEEMLKQKQQIAVIDPTGAWWGLKSSADGKAAGYEVIVFGGSHADAPLDYRAGKAMCAAFVEYGFSAIFDIRTFETDQQLQFVMEFCSELLRVNREAVHIFMDEADTFAPQTPKSVMANKCLGTVSRLVKQGGLSGVGFTMITQRSASINWDILSQIDILTILRMSAPHDVTPVVKWLQSETTLEFAAEVKAALPSLPIGTAFFASAPLHIAQRVQVREKRTFNSGATPKPGERRAEPKVMAQVDVEKLGRQIASSVAEAKANSPEELKREIARLQKLVGKGEISMELSKHIEELEKKAALIPGLEARVESAEGGAAAAKAAMQGLLGELRAVLEKAEKEVGASRAAVPSRAVPRAATPIPVAEVSAHIAAASESTAENEDSKLSGPQQRVLEALATLNNAGVTSPARIHVCLLSGYGNVSSTGFVKAVGGLRSAGLIDYPDGGKLALTPAGLAVTPAGRNLVSDEDLQQLIFGIIGGPEQRILRSLIERYPDPISREDAMVAGGYTNLSSTGFVKALGRLRSLGYAEYPSTGQVVATEQCFLPARR